MFYHRMYLRRCSMSSISEESETADDEKQDDQTKLSTTNNLAKVDVQNCLGDLNSFKQEIQEAYEDLSSLERQARCSKTLVDDQRIEQDNDDLDSLLEQLHTLEQRLDQPKISTNKSISSAIIAQFDQLDRALATLTKTMNNVEIELNDSANCSSSSSGLSDSTRVHQQNESDEHFSDSGLSQSTDSISLSLIQQQQLSSNTSSIFSFDQLKTNVGDQQIRLALEKMHEANIKKLFVKIHHDDDQSTKNVLIDETMSIHQLVLLLLHKFHLRPTLNYVIVEDLPDLHLCRTFEDHQNLINDGLIYWPRDTINRIRFSREKHRYEMFEDPKKFFSNQNEMNDVTESTTIHLPDDIINLLFIKDKTRKVWKKSTCVLRQSGIYQLPKSSTSKHDLICLVKFDKNIQLYQSNRWIETFRSPTEFGFALKYAHIQKKSTKYIHYLCTQTIDEYYRWINGIRLILFGDQIYRNYQQMKQIVHDGLENLINRLPEQRQFNFIQSITSSMNDSLSTISLPINQIVSHSMNTSKSLVDLDLTSTSKTNFFSLDRQKKTKKNFSRSSSFQSTSSSKSQQMTKKETTTSIFPLIHQCIHSDRTKKSNDSMENHIYDSLQNIPFPINDIDYRTVTSISGLPATRVTEL